MALVAAQAVAVALSTGFSRTQRGPGKKKEKKKRDPGFGQAHVRHVLAVSAAILEGPGGLAYEMQGREARSTYRNRGAGKKCQGPRWTGVGQRCIFGLFGL